MKMSKQKKKPNNLVYVNTDYMNRPKSLGNMEELIKIVDKVLMRSLLRKPKKK